MHPRSYLTSQESGWQEDLQDVGSRFDLLDVRCAADFYNA